jgi:methionyl-tRNA formyltransferase
LRDLNKPQSIRYRMVDTQKVDLFLGNRIGLWMLDYVSVDQIGQVFTFDDEIAQTAYQRGVRVSTENANTTDFSPSSTGLSVHYPRILKPHLISRYERLYNLHPGFLPWGRGFYPVFWALWEQTPAGATLHEIIEGVDEGPVVAQIQVEYDEQDTGGSLHRRVEQAEKQMIMDFWPRILSGEQLPSSVQLSNVGSSHLKKEFIELKHNAPVQEMSATQFIRLARCLTFPGYTGLEITIPGKKFAVHLEEIEG